MDVIELAIEHVFGLHKVAGSWCPLPYNGALNFATDGWTSPNNKAYIAVTVHFEKEGVPVSMLLDLVEVARSHSGLNVKTVRKPRFRSAAEMRKSCGKISENRRDVASTYVLRPRLGIKCPEFRMVRKKDLE